MLATQEAQVIPITDTEHFCTLTSAQLGRELCDPVPLLTPALLGDGKSERPEGPELTGLGLLWLWVLRPGSEEKKVQSQEEQDMVRDLKIKDLLYCHLPLINVPQQLCDTLHESIKITNVQTDFLLNPAQTSSRAVLQNKHNPNIFFVSQMHCFISTSLQR